MFMNSLTSQSGILRDLYPYLLNEHGFPCIYWKSGSYSKGSGSCGPNGGYVCLFWGEAHRCSISILYSLLLPPPPPHMCMLTYSHMPSHIYTCAHTHTPVHTDMHAHPHTYAHVCTHGNFPFLVGGEEIISPSSSQHSFGSLLRGMTTSCQTQLWRSLSGQAWPGMRSRGQSSDKGN